MCLLCLLWVARSDVSGFPAALHWYSFYVSYYLSNQFMVNKILLFLLHVAQMHTCIPNIFSGCHIESHRIHLVDTLCWLITGECWFEEITGCINWRWPSSQSRCTCQVLCRFKLVMWSLELQMDQDHMLFSNPVMIFFLHFYNALAWNACRDHTLWQICPSVHQVLI